MTKAGCQAKIYECITIFLTLFMCRVKLGSRIDTIVSSHWALSQQGVPQSGLFEEQTFIHWEKVAWHF